MRKIINLKTPGQRVEHFRRLSNRSIGDVLTALIDHRAENQRPNIEGSTLFHIHNYYNVCLTSNAILARHYLNPNRPNIKQ